MSKTVKAFLCGTAVIALTLTAVVLLLPSPAF